MKTKRLITLALCLLLACSMTVPGVAASAYTDSDMIGEVYSDAIEDMTTRGVLNGFPDGSFRPKSGLTRAQGAKIVAYLILGADAADSLVCYVGPFTDVPAELWSAPVVAWCAERQIVHGMGDGSFKPDSPLTGQQFAKILLCAFDLGDPDRYVGDGWDIRVTEDAAEKGLLEGDEEMCSDQPISRQQASLMALNAQKKTESLKSPAMQQPAGEPVGPVEGTEPNVPPSQPEIPTEYDDLPTIDESAQAEDPGQTENQAQTEDPGQIENPGEPENPEQTETPGDDNETSMMTDF